MKITVVRYEALFNKGNYENEKLGLTAELEPGDDVTTVVASLREQVFEMADRQEDYNARLDARRELRTLEGKLEDARHQWEEVSSFLKAQGLKAEPAPFPTLVKAITAKAEYERIHVDEIDVLDQNMHPHEPR